MLILSRGIGESIMIGDDIEIVIMDIRGTDMRIGIKAPKDVNIVRTELLQRTEKQVVTKAIGQ
ncbi:MAG: carbon storage regulator [Sedimenticola sp.]|nr:MAG: carbon storage regulator [Sedimenticola sp.]